MKTVFAPSPARDIGDAVANFAAADPVAALAVGVAVLALVSYFARNL